MGRPESRGFRLKHEVAAGQACNTEDGSTEVPTAQGQKIVVPKVFGQRQEDGCTKVWIAEPKSR